MGSPSRRRPTLTPRAPGRARARLPEPPLWSPLVIDNEAEFLALYGPEALEDARLVAMDEGW